MSVATKTAAVLATTAVFVGLGSLASTAFADTPSTATTTVTAAGSQLGSTQGFHITNMSGDALTLTRVDGSPLGSAPAVGSVLQPGGDADFEVNYTSAWDTDTIYYTNPQGRTVIIGIGVEGGTIPESQCISSGGYDCSRPFLHQKYLTIADPAGTVREFHGTQAQAEAAVAQQLCANNSRATCTFTPEGKVENIFGPRHLIAEHANNDHKTDEWKVTRKDEAEESNSLDISISAGTKFDVFGQEIKMEVKTAYDHEWSSSHGFDVSDTIEVEPGYTSYFYGVDPVLRYHGTVTVTMGRTTWKLHGVNFDTPDVEGIVKTDSNQAPTPPASLTPPHHT